MYFPVVVSTTQTFLHQVLKSLLHGCYMRLEKIFNVLKILWVNGRVSR